MPDSEFEAQKRASVRKLSHDAGLRDTTMKWIIGAARHKYTHNFSWLGRPIIQFPQDIVALQEVIWAVRPQLVIETGIARGGSLVFFASMLELLGEDGVVVGIDIDIREHNRVEIERHPLFKRIVMIQGSSVEEAVVQQVYGLAAGKNPIMAVLDSNHTHDHVLHELQIYSQLVTRGSYLVVLDTVVEDMPEDTFPDRPWGRGNNPRTALRKFLETNDRFIADLAIGNKLLITVAPDGYLKCVKD